MLLVFGLLLRQGLSVHPRQALDRQESSCFCLLDAGIKGTHHTPCLSLLLQHLLYLLEHSGGPFYTSHKNVSLLQIPVLEC